MLCQQKAVHTIIKKYIYHTIKNVDYYKSSGLSNLLVVSIYSIVAFKMMKLVEVLISLPPYRKNWVI